MLLQPLVALVFKIMARNGLILPKRPAWPPIRPVVARKGLTAISRTLSHALRHEPWHYEVEFDAEGWTPVEAVLAALRAERSDWQGLTADNLAAMIAASTKRRREMADGRIRALYGHSVPGKLARTPSTPPDWLYHGTAPRALEAIRQNGLQPMARQYVHLSNNRAHAIEVGRRKHPKPVLLLVNRRTWRRPASRSISATRKSGSPSACLRNSSR